MDYFKKKKDVGRDGKENKNTEKARNDFLQWRKERLQQSSVTDSITNQDGTYALDQIVSEDPIEEDINPRPVIREREKKRDFERRLNYWFTNSNERRQYNKWIQDTDFTFSFELNFHT